MSNHIDMISLDEFKKIDFVIAEIVEVRDHPDADKLYVLVVDMGSEKRQVVAGVKKYYLKEDLIGKQAVIVKNLIPSVIRGVKSEGMLLAASSDNVLSIISPDKFISNGGKVS